MSRWTRLVLLLPLCLACAPARAGDEPNPGGPDVITREQIASTYFRNAYDLVEALHGNWLRSRGPDTILGEVTVVRVYLDGMRYGDPPSLKDIHTSTIESIRFITGIDAAGRWGLDHGAGVIQVTTRSR